jgi:ubiquinone/menaquinone biosynthesis C-methylase UbiE
MKKRITKRILTHHKKLYEQFHSSPKALGILKGQSIRFQVACEIGIKNDSSVLDIGCGFGDFCGFLRFKKIKVKYHGVDINDDFIEIAKKKYPYGKFEVRDIESNPITKKYDWVIGIGISTLSSSENIKPILREMFKICKKGIVIDFLSSYVDYKEKNLFYTSPEQIFKYAKTLSKRITLRHDYKPFEFCLYIFKEDKKTAKNYFQYYFNSLPKSIQNDSWLQEN